MRERKKEKRRKRKEKTCFTLAWNCFQTVDRGSVVVFCGSFVLFFTINEHIRIRILASPEVTTNVFAIQKSTFM